LYAALARWVTPAQALAAADGPQAADFAEFSPLSSFDVAAGLRRTRNDPALYRRLLLMMREQFLDFPGRYRTARMDPDPQAALRLAHSLRGLAETLGAVALVPSARALEEAARQGSTDEAAVRLDRLAGPLRQALDEIAILTNGASAGDAMPLSDRPDARPRLARLAELLEEGDGESGDALDGILADHPELAGALDPLRRHVVRYDFRAARREIEQVLSVSDALP
jgi:HPt (histidine-containing phosphotransfer) domain-containing protein